MQGFGPEENSWEPRENLECPELIKIFEDEVKMKREHSKRKGIILQSDSVILNSLVSLLSGSRLGDEDNHRAREKSQPRGWLGYPSSSRGLI